MLISDRVEAVYGNPLLIKVKYYFTTFYLNSTCRSIINIYPI